MEPGAGPTDGGDNEGDPEPQAGKKGKGSKPVDEKAAKAKAAEFSSDVLRGESVGLYKRPLSAHFPLDLPTKNTSQQVNRNSLVCHKLWLWLGNGMLAISK